MYKSRFQRDFFKTCSKRPKWREVSVDIKILFPGIVCPWPAAIYIYFFFPTNRKRFLVGNIYRHRNETISWNEEFDNYLDKVLECEKEIYLMGDFNRDLMQDNMKPSWLEYMESFGLHQVVNIPTRVTDRSATLIDHIYSNTHANILTTAVHHLGLWSFSSFHL